MGPTALSTLAKFIPDMAAMKNLRLDGNSITGSKYKRGGKKYGVEEYDCDLAGISALCEAMKTSSISILSLADCEIGVNGISTLAKFIPDITALSTVNLCDNANINVADIEAVKIAAPNVSIEH